MELKNNWVAPNKGALARLLQWVNLRPEESDRTLLMFIFYTVVSVGLRWIEDCTVALFLDKNGADPLPWIYIASGPMGAGLVFLYSWLQKIFPLRWVVVAIAPCMVTPLVLLVFLNSGIQQEFLAVITIFLLRLWVDAIYVVNDLNTSIVANQLFNIREIKRTYPLVSSGILVADVVSGFSLPLLLQYIKLDKVILIGAVVIVLGAGILRYLTLGYPQAFADSPQQLLKEAQPFTRQRLSGRLKRYALLLFAFVGLIQVIGVLIDFQYLNQLKSNFADKDIAKFLGVFSGTAGLCELAMQLFISSRLLERFGVFITVATLPAMVTILLPITIPLFGLFEATKALDPSQVSLNFFVGLVILKFFDDLLRYTFVASGGPLLFQPIPDKIRSRIQTLSGGIAEPLATCCAGVIILLSLGISARFASVPLQNWVLVVETILVAVTCLGVIWLLRSHYVDLLVLSAGRGQLSATDVDLRALKQAVVKALAERGTEGDKLSCIELLTQIDPQGAGEVLAPLLLKLAPSLQKPSLEVMLSVKANPAYLPQVRTLLEVSSSNPEIFALAMRYVWLAEANPDLSQLEEYLKAGQHSLIRATAAALLLRQGTPMQKVAAMHTLRRMLTHKLEFERVNGVKALTEAVYLQALRIHIPNLLQDESLGVRCAVLEMIAATHLEEYYSALLAGLYYKSTRTTAIRALVRLENEALPMLSKLATNTYKPQVVRMYAWRTIGKIGTLQAIDTLWLHLETSWGTTRDHILGTLLKRHQQEGIIGFVDRFHESRVETLIDQELRFLGEIYAAYIDFNVQGNTYATYIDFKTQKNQDNHQSTERIIAVCQLLQRALLELEMDILNRLLLLLKLLYPLEKMQAATFNLQSDSGVKIARGLEILEHTITLENKSLLLNILDKRSPEEKLQHLVSKGMAEYQQMAVNDRTRKLLGFGNLLSDWCLACCFHFAQVAHIRLTSPEILTTLRHPTGFVREATIAYLSVVSKRILIELLPQLKNDPHPLVVAQIKAFIEKYHTDKY